MKSSWSEEFDKKAMTIWDIPTIDQKGIKELVTKELAKQRTKLLKEVKEKVEELRINPQASWNKKSSESVKVKMMEVNNNLDDVLKKLEIISKEVNR